MYCHHCEGEIGESFGVKIEDTIHYFCSKPCAFVLMRQEYEPDIREAIQKFNKKAVDLRRYLDEDEFHFREMKKMGIHTMSEAIAAGRIQRTHPNMNCFDSFEEDLVYSRLEHKMCVLMVKTNELLLQRKPILYNLFKEKLLSVWEELLALSPNDFQRLKKADLFSFLYDKLKSYELPFGL
jgi:hypothetical protein